MSVPVRLRYHNRTETVPVTQRTQTETQRRSAWSKAETDHLRDLVGEHPWLRLVPLYQRWAERNGFPMRTGTALQSKTQRLRLGRRCDGKEWISVGTVLALTGRSSYFTKQLVHRWGVARRGGSWGTVLSRRDLRRVAREHPEVFAGCPRGGLVQLFESEEYADRIVDAYPRPGFRPQRVLVVETGVVHPSCSAAARALGVRSDRHVRARTQNGQVARFGRYTVRRVP